MINGITSSGFHYEIDENRLSDWRVVKKLSKLKNIKEESSESALEFISIMSDIEELIFDDGGDAFESHILKKNDGYVAPAVALRELLEILQSNKTTKN